MNVVAIPWFLNPAKNLLIRWFFAPVGVCLGCYLVVVGGANLYFSKDARVESCLVQARIVKGDNHPVVHFVCADAPERTFVFVGGKKASIVGFEGKDISFTFADNPFEKNVRFISYNGHDYSGAMPDDHRVFWTLMYGTTSLFLIVGGLFLIFIFKHTRWYESFERGWVVGEE